MIWAFRKSTLENDTKMSWFPLGVSLILSHLNELKKNFNQLPSWDFIFFKTSTINLYENTKN